MFDLTSPSSAFTGKMLSTSRLYRGRNAEQQPQQPWYKWWKKKLKKLKFDYDVCWKGTKTKFAYSLRSFSMATKFFTEMKMKNDELNLLNFFFSLDSMTKVNVYIVCEKCNVLIFWRFVCLSLLLGLSILIAYIHSAHTSIWCTHSRSHTSQ